MKQVTRRSHALPRWSWLGLSASLPLVLLALVLLTASMAAAEPFSPQAGVSGKVIAPDGSEISEATQVYMEYLPPPGNWWDEWDTYTDTDDLGYFFINETIPAELLPGEFALKAAAPWDSMYYDSLPMPVGIEDDGDFVPVGFVTLTHASLEGIVHEPDGTTPAQWGWVEALALPLEEWQPVAGGDYNEFGEYAVGGMPNGVFWLVAHPPDDSLFWHSEPMTISVAGGQYDPGAEIYQDLDLRDTNVHGTVVYPDGTTPAGWMRDGTGGMDDDVIGYAEVKAVNADWTLDAGRPTIPSGEFGLLLPPGDYEMWAEPQDAMAMEHTRSIPRHVPVGPGGPIETGPLKLTFPSFAGQVFDLDGNPVPDCLSVWLEDMMGNWMVDYWYCPPMEPLNQRAPEEGPRYMLGGIPGGEYWLKTDGLPDYGLLPPEPILVHVAPGSQYNPDATQWLDLYLEPAAGPLEVSVVDPMGVDIAAHVALYDEWGNEMWQQDSFPGEPAVFFGLWPGDYQIQAWPMEYDIPALANSDKMWVWVGEGLVSRVLRLRPPDVIGRVTTPEGFPLPPAHDDEENPVPHPAHVQVHNGDWSVEVWAMTNPAGEFALALPPGHYELLAGPEWSLNFTYTKSNLVMFPLPDPAGAHPRDLGDVPLTYPRIWGWVEDPDGMRISTWVDIWSDSGYWDGTDTYWNEPWTPDMPFKFGGLPPGQYFVQAQAPWENPMGWGASEIYDFEVFGPADLTEEILLTLGIANFVGDLRFPPDSFCSECPVQNVEVALFDADWNYLDDTWTGGDGRFTFSGLEPGDYIVEVYLPQELQLDWDPPYPEHFNLASPDEPVMRTLFLRHALRTKHVIGEVVYENGDPVGDGLVYAFNVDSGYWVGEPTQPDGYYELGLRGGLWKVGVEPMYAGVDWFFDPSWEQSVWFPLDATLEVTKMVNLTVVQAEFFQVSGVVKTPNGAPIVPGTVGVELCNDEGHCFGNEVGPDGRFAVRAIPGGYDFSIWVDPDTNLLPPLNNNFFIFVDGDWEFEFPFWLRALGDRTASVSGRIIISSTGTGLAGVGVEAWTDEGDWNHTKTITGGNYVLRLFPGHWHGGPLLTPEQEEQYVVLPPRHRDGRLKAGETISNVNFYLLRRDAKIQGQVVDISSTLLVSDINAIVFAEYCPSDGTFCDIVADAEVRSGKFELRVVGGLTYTLGIWIPEGGYMPGPPVEVFVARGATASAQVGVIEAGTKIHGFLFDAELNPVEVPALIYGVDPYGLWAETHVPGVEDYKYNLYVPTPDTVPVTWTLGLWVDPSTGYIADPSHPNYEVVIPPGETLVPQHMYVQELDTQITGTVKMFKAGSGVIPAPFVWVFAEGMENTDSEGLYFEAQANKDGEFAMDVIPGEYLVSAYRSPDMVGKFYRPEPQEWYSVGDNPIELTFRPVPVVGAVSINGDLDFGGTLSLGMPGEDEPIHVFGWSPDGSFSEVTGTVRNGYSLPVIADSTWYLWAVYEDPDNDEFYHSQEVRVKVGANSVNGIDLTLAKSPYPLPDSECWSFEPDDNTRLYLPAREDLFEPIVDISAGTMPVSGTVTVCATPLVAVPQGQYLVGFAYELDARDSQGNLITQNFNGTVRLQFYFNQDALGDANPEDVELKYYSSVRQEWVALDNPYVDPEDLFATGKINHFSKMGVLSAPPAGDYYIYLPLVLKNYGG